MSDPLGAPLDYLVGLLPGAVPLEVLDIGANPIEGDAPYTSLLQAGRARVTGFEPQEGPLAELLARKTEAETYLPHALGDGEAAQLHLCAHSGFTSLFPVRPEVASLIGAARATRSRESVAVRTVRLDDLDRVGRVDFLKIDVQGAERDIILHGRTKLAEAVLIQTEVRFLPLYVGEPGFAGLDLVLREQGFLFHDFAFLKRVPLGRAGRGALRRSAYRQVVDGDAYYICDITRPEALSETRLARLALLAEAVVGSPTLVLFCLDTLAARGAVPPGATDDYLARLPDRMKRVH